MLTKKWYEAIAAVIYNGLSHRPTLEKDTLCALCTIQELGELFETDNPQFDWSRWEQACGLEDEDEPEQTEE